MKNTTKMNGLYSNAVLRYNEEGAVLSEFIQEGRRCLILRRGDKEQCFELYRLEELNASSLDAPRYYLGHELSEVLNSGRDLLGEEVLAQGEPAYDQVRKILPSIHHNAYCFLGGALSWGSVIIDQMGRIYPQSSGRDHQPAPVFQPVQIDLELGEQKPFQRLLNGYLPVLASIHTDGQKVMEILAFIEPGDPDRDPLVWIRASFYQMDTLMDVREEYIIASASRAGVTKTEPTLFWEALCSTLIYWTDYVDNLAQFSLPEAQLQQTTTGTMISLATTFSGEHTHYGHREYGWEAQDHFPPVIIWAVEAYCVQGWSDQAARYLRYLFKYSIDHLGRFVYRQGPHELRGVSASEYGQLLFMIERYSKAMHLWDWMSPYYPKLVGMGRELLRHRLPCSECGGRRLIQMCAEADTNGRIYTYASNNLWAIQGLKSLVRLMREHGDNAAEEIERETELLWQDFREALDESVEDSPFGPLVPFRFGYSTQPLTLSSCSEPLGSLSVEERRRYFEPSNTRIPIARTQDYIENTYANYRYYLEMLSSMLLRDEERRSLVRMRENMGGEFLGMTRFLGWFDDWPVKHYARYLLETGSIDKYLLLLFAHTAHHGNPDLMIYYEQVSADGRVMASDCVPSLLTTPLMIAWMFAFEPMEKPVIQLLRAVPRAWFREGFSVRRIGTSRGVVDLSVTVREDEIRIFGNLKALSGSGEVELWVRCFDQITAENLVSGEEAVRKIDRNTLHLQEGLRSFDIVLCGERRTKEER
jgi:hypothetical protein